jgi:hypothetical protein
LTGVWWQPVKKSSFQGYCVWAEQGGLRLETEEGFAANSPRVTVHICKEFLQQRCMSHMNLIMGCVVGKLTVNGTASVCTFQWNLHLRLMSLYCPKALLPKEALNMGFRVIRCAFI